MAISGRTEFAVRRSAALKSVTVRRYGALTDEFVVLLHLVTAGSLSGSTRPATQLATQLALRRPLRLRGEMPRPLVLLDPARS